MNSDIPPMQHDTTFKLLLKDKKELLLLIKDILKYKWADSIEEDSIEFDDSEFVTQHLSQLRADIVAKAKLKDTEVFFYILIENQSTVRRDMAQKILKYMVSLWWKELSKGAENLPPVIPIVVYNGINEKWNISTDLMEAFETFKDDVFRYRVVDVFEIDVKHILEQERDLLMPIVFYLEQVREDRDELIRRLFAVEKNLEKLSSENIERFLRWAYYIIRPRLTEEGREEYDRLSERVERGGGKNMGDFVSNVARLLDEAKTKDFNLGLQQGLQQGLKQGMRESQIKIAKKMILKGAKDEEIAEITELDIEEIKKLRKELLN
ncbi:Rpn family recombination-promoting nuclease/putative transposase [Anaerocellum danielii]|uniref:Rpn family recombination-promoting nuclease/putative transposase n=1 Tax=Anaerocellum danielii TaxID=1387557 RepID=A0ABZ0TZ92_9FIRM|nr:Rpn family recombination-promoting nuclease/putative transposase [Caldicellulosiruptor danielii]WPX08798.1 Rpn family recombination-promoting nuclease/putative transposase [Caldicellulosiruptor danielii]